MDKIIHLSLSVNINYSHAFKFFYDSKLLENWLAGLADVEPRKGGKYELFWDPENKHENSTMGCKITAFVKNEMIAFEWKSPKQFAAFANSADPLTHVTVSFAAPDENITNIHLIHSGWRNTPEWEEARLWQENAWKTAFTSLDELVRHM